MGDRGGPLDTGVVRPMWHADGTSGAEHASDPRRDARAYAAAIDLLRKWYRHDPERFEEFGCRYREDLKDADSDPSAGFARGGSRPLSRLDRRLGLARAASWFPSEPARGIRLEVMSALYRIDSRRDPP